jgi:hypothetical protein
MLDTLSQVLPKHGISPALFMRRSRHAFAPLNLEGKTVLDVGSGIGWASYFAAASGAKRVVSVEPEAAGSRSAMLETAEAIRDELGFRGIVEIVPRTIQEAGLNETFDVVLHQVAYRSGSLGLLFGFDGRHRGALRAWRPAARHRLHQPQSVRGPRHEEPPYPDD